MVNSVKKIDYVEKIKESAKNISFDDTAKRIFEEYIVFEQKNAKKIYTKLCHLPKDNFYTNNEINIEKYINKIFAGYRNSESKQSLYHDFSKYNAREAKLSSVVVTGLSSSITNTAIIENSENYVKQLFNLAQSVGANVKLGYPQNEQGCHFLFESDIGIVCNLSENRQFEYFHQLLFRYMYYNLMVYDERIKCNNKEKRIKELSDKNQKIKDLYLYLSSFFNNTDFEYAILTYLDTEEKIDLYNLCLKKNETWNSHSQMDKDILQHISNAASLYGKPCPKKVIFLQDIAQKRKQTTLGKELFNRLSVIFKDSRDVVEMLVYLRTEKMQKEMINFLNTGEKNKIKIKNRLYEIIL